MAWDLDSLREHFGALHLEADRRYEQRFDAQEKAVAAALKAAQEAVLKAEAAAERRFESVNEFRGALTDQAATFVSRDEMSLMAQPTTVKVDQLLSRMDRLEGRSSGLNAGWIMLGQAVSLLGAVIAVAFALAR